MSLRRRLSILVAVALAPPFILTVFNAAGWQIHLEKDARADAVSDAQLVSTQIGQMIEGGRQLLLTISKYPRVDRDADCAAYFKSVIADLPIYRGAAIIDMDGKFHCSTIAIPPDLDVRDRVYYREPLASRKFTIGNLTKGRVTHSTSIHLSMPYQSPDGSLSGVIAVILNPEMVAEALAVFEKRVHGRIIVVDREGAVVLNVPPMDMGEANAIVKSIFSRLTLISSGTIDTNIPSGRPQIVAYKPVVARTDGLFALIAIDRKTALAKAWDITAHNLGLGLITIFLAIGGTWLTTHFFIVRPIWMMVRVARRREKGDSDARFPELRGGTEFGELSSALSRMSDKVDELLGQKALLLREVQHRVMNSLNLLSSIFDIQRRQSITTDLAREQLDRARNRVVAMGTIYRFLYSTDAVDNIEVSELLRSICKESENAYEGPVKLEISVEAEHVVLSGSNAISLAMLTHELITNSIKHAYEEGEVGRIGVSFKRLPDGGFEYRFADRGRGLPNDFQLEKSDSLGMVMITATARQLDGKLEINRLNPGTEFVLQLPPGIEKVKAA